MKAGVWKHYKGGLYQVLGIAAHSETGEEMVVYIALTGAHLSGPRMRVRPLKMWYDRVDWGGNIGMASRFIYLGPEVPKEDRPAVSTDIATG